MVDPLAKKSDLKRAKNSGKETKKGKNKTKMITTKSVLPTKIVCSGPGPGPGRKVEKAFLKIPIYWLVFKGV